MKAHPAIALLDFAEIPAGVLATDAMVKKSPISLLRCGTITGGRFLTLIGGSTAAVAEAFGEGLYWGGTGVLDHVFLADVHPQLYDALFGRPRVEGGGTLAVLTTDSVPAAVRAAEAALKGTPVTLVEIRLADSGLAGKGLVVFRGELHDVEAAVALALAAAGPGRQVSHRILTAPHEAVWQQLDSTSLFAQVAAVALEGEEG